MVVLSSKALAAGAAAGAAAGIAYFALAASKPMKKHNIKKHAGKAIKAAESLFDDLFM